MGADMIVSMVAALVGTEPDFDAGRRALAEVADREVFRFDEPEWQIPCLLDDVGECDLDEEGEFSLAILKRAAARILDRLETALDSRRTTTLEIGGYWVYLSGGLSWGDGPTVEYDAIADSDYLPCTVTTAIGFVNDPSKPIDPVKHRDDEASLAARVLRQEHRIYPQAVRWFAEDRLHLENGRVRLAAELADGAVLIAPEVR